MKFKINNIEWKIKEISLKEINQKYMDTHNGEVDNKELYCFGLCRYPENIIFLNKEICLGQKRKTLMHELVHCYLWSVGMQYNQFEEEDLCNVVSASNEFINEIVSKYFKDTK